MVRIYCYEMIAETERKNDSDCTYNIIIHTAQLLYWRDCGMVDDGSGNDDDSTVYTHV